VRTGALRDRHGGPLLDSVQGFTHEFTEADSTIQQAITAIGRRQLSRVNWHPEGELQPGARLAAIDGAAVLGSRIGRNARNETKTRARRGVVSLGQWCYL
jgi:hypothetical protein